MAKKYRGRRKGKGSKGFVSLAQQRAVMALLAEMGLLRKSRTLPESLDEITTRIVDETFPYSRSKVKGWGVHGEGIARAVLTHPQSRVALKVGRTVWLDDQGGGWEDRDAAKSQSSFGYKPRPVIHRQQHAEIQRLREIGGLLIDLRRKGEERFKIRVPRLLMVSKPTGRVAAVQFAPGQHADLDDWSEFGIKGLSKAKKRYKFGDLHGENVHISGPKGKTIWLVDLGIPRGQGGTSGYSTTGGWITATPRPRNPRRVRD